MKRFIEGEDRRQATLLPDSLEDYVTEDNPVRVVDVFIDELDLEGLAARFANQSSQSAPADVAVPAMNRSQNSV
jgi:transposase